MKKIISVIYQLLFVFPFVLFLLFTGNEHQSTIPKILFITCITLLLFFGITQPKFYKIELEKDELITIPLVLIGTLATYSFQNYLQFNPILSAGIVGLSATLFDRKKNFSIPIYCGAFVGMTNPNHHFPFWLMSINGTIAGLLFYFGKSFYGGIGGKLGTIAFGSVLVGLFLYKWYSNGFSF